MELKGTTIVAVMRDGQGAIAGDGQVTMVDKVIIKQRANKIRRIYEGRVLVGFAGSVADAFTLFERLEGKLEESRGNLPKAAVALAKEWRTDKILRRLEAMLVALDPEHLFVISGCGEVIEPDDKIAAIGSGGPYALAAARALNRFTNLDARTIAEESLRIAASICVFTNDNIVVETVGVKER
ncbi:MAG TPA: ATP-dependent protease subunit HslV [Clostridia bacterium]|nr:ATP-dependent protease subunit HslV [Clostridia bacterium]